MVTVKFTGFDFGLTNWINWHFILIVMTTTTTMMMMMMMIEEEAVSTTTMMPRTMISSGNSDDDDMIFWSRRQDVSLNNIIEKYIYLSHIALLSEYKYQSQEKLKWQEW